MQPSQPMPRKNKPILLVIGILILLLSCLFSVGSLMLDLVGTKAIGKLSNAAVGCSRGDSCWTGRVDFTTQSGEEVSFHPMTAPMLFDFDPALSGRPYEQYGEYQVRYLESFPKLAKVKLAFFLEYINLLGGVGLGAFLTLIGFLISGDPNKPRKPLVLDLSRLRKK